MENKKMVIETNLGMIDYINVVNQIESEYFSDDEYVPHIGMLNAMRVFYNNCVKESKFEEELGDYISNSQAMSMVEIVNDEEFINAFNSALLGNGKIQLDFANAYSDAMKIVDSKKNSIERIMQIVKNTIGGIVDMMSPALSSDNIANISKIMKHMKDGNITADSIVQAYIKEMKAIRDNSVSGEAK